MMRRGGLTYGHAPLFTTGTRAGATFLLTQVVFLFVNVIFILKVRFKSDRLKGKNPCCLVRMNKFHQTMYLLQAIPVVVLVEL